MLITKKAMSPKHVIIIAISTVVLLIASFFAWFWVQSMPVGSKSDPIVKVEIKPGMNPETIGAALEKAGVIRSSFVFGVRVKMMGVGGQLRSGSFSLSPGLALDEVITKITKGSDENLKITFFPGATLFDPTDTKDNERTDVLTILLRAGFQEDEIRQALSKTRKGDLFAGKPDGSNIEGYIFGETYSFDKGVSLEVILQHVFDIYYAEIKKYNIEALAKEQGMTLFQAITLASIIEKEARCPSTTEPCQDRKQVSQVFHSRLAIDMPLGSDVTFIYAADQQNKPRRVDLESPYNTRIHKGLPPGPIATPSISSLRAAVAPAKGDYLYFVAGDDGKTTYFAKDFAGHEENIAKHCIKGCGEP